MGKAYICTTKAEKGKTRKEFIFAKRLLIAAVLLLFINTAIPLSAKLIPSSLSNVISNVIINFYVTVLFHN